MFFKKLNEKSLKIESTIAFKTEVVDSLLGFNYIARMIVRIFKLSFIFTLFLSFPQTSFAENYEKKIRCVIPVSKEVLQVWIDLTDTCTGHAVSIFDQSDETKAKETFTTIPATNPNPRYCGDFMVTPDDQFILEASFDGPIYERIQKQKKQKKVERKKNKNISAVVPINLIKGTIDIDIGKRGRGVPYGEGTLTTNDGKKHPLTNCSFI